MPSIGEEPDSMIEYGAVSREAVADAYHCAKKRVEYLQCGTVGVLAQPPTCAVRATRFVLVQKLAHAFPIPSNLLCKLHRNRD